MGGGNFFIPTEDSVWLNRPQRGEGAGPQVRGGGGGGMLI